MGRGVQIVLLAGKHAGRSAVISGDPFEHLGELWYPIDITLKKSIVYGCARPYEFTLEGGING